MLLLALFRRVEHTYCIFTHDVPCGCSTRQRGTEGSTERRSMRGTMRGNIFGPSRILYESLSLYPGNGWLVILYRILTKVE